FPVQFYYSTALDSLGTARQQAYNASMATGGNGVYATVYFNKSRRVPGAEAGVPFSPIYDPQGNIVIDLQPGGESNEIDFRNQSRAGLVSVQINGILGGAAQGQADPTFTNIVNSSANLAAHETGHLLGLRHADSFAPISLGVHNPPGILAYDPAYPGPAAAFETNRDIMASNGATGMTFSSNSSDLFTSEY